MCQHGVCPVLDGVILSQIEFSNQHVDDSYQIGDEHHALGCSAVQIAAEIGHCIEEIYGCYRRDETVHGNVLALINQSGELPYGHTCHNAKQQHHSLWAQETGHNRRDKDNACNRSDNKVLHETPPSAPEGATFE